MMRVTVAVVGRIKQQSLAAVIGEYETRAARYWKLQVKEVKAERATALREGEVRRREAARLLQAVGAGPFVACDERGRTFTSAAFARWLGAERDAARDVTFVIGGAFGLDAAVRDAAASTLALAPWTLPHELARLVLAEQLYRAGSILRGEPYHK